ncbi:hypothetical protein ACFDDV_10820 [Enterococcus lactis]|uniref:hypothetical protein n=1 Tax=Enterococcus lactis TaxID=357441 RepID=UPI0015B3B816|nr:hypothetical protein [Enterococcus lactis]NWJ14229.1 hypothetical protein [Clostridium perfringens]
MNPQIQKNSEMLAIEIGKLTMQNIELQVACEFLKNENKKLKDEIDSKSEK